VVASPTQGGQRVTGLRIGRGAQVTGLEPGAAMPVSGTQYIGAEGVAARAAATKVGQMRSAGGLVVSGTLVRSQVRITGDEAGNRIGITGEADPRPEDDLTPRSGAHVGAQFPRRSQPHGASVFGRPGAARSRAGAIEFTIGGQAVTGTALGRSARVTGDHDGACRAITGDQYASRAGAECGGRGGGSAPAEHLGAVRRDPVTGAKVTEARTWSGMRVTGPDLEHRPRVTGDEPGCCATLTGTQYQGPSTLSQWCDPAQAQAAQSRRPRPAEAAVTGDVPRHDPQQVTGTERGAVRAITGTPYFRDEPQPAPVTDPVAALDARFSVGSPQRAAQLRAGGAARGEGGANGGAARITGAFAVGQGKVTGNLEFAFRPRHAANAGAERPRITGEGRTQGTAVSGDAWADHPRVTGTEGRFADQRNASQRAGKPHAFAGSGLFKGKGHHDEPRQIVTGMIGWTAKSAAKVTLSGGAQG